MMESNSRASRMLLFVTFHHMKEVFFMPYNLPKYSANRFSIGPCVVYMGPFRTVGGAPTV